MNWVRYGPNALLFRFADRVDDEALAKGCAIAAELEQNPPAGMIEYVPAFSTILVSFETAEQSALAAVQLGRRLQKCVGKSLPERPIREIPVVYDGPDLQRVAELHDLTASDVAKIHAATTYKVYMLGFAPGFPYLGDLDPRLHTPRLGAPRTRVTAGSVAIGGSHTGIYSVDSPGGWNIIGHTGVRLFDAGAEAGAMFLLRQGDRVRFVAR